MILIRCHVPVLCSNLVELLATKTICQKPVYKVSGLVVKDLCFCVLLTALATQGMLVHS